LLYVSVLRSDIENLVSASLCIGQLRNGDTVLIATRLQRGSKRVAARHEGGHTPLSRTSMADLDDCTRRVSAWSKHPGFRNHLISLLME